MTGLGRVSCFVVGASLVSLTLASCQTAPPPPPLPTPEPSPTPSPAPPPHEAWMGPKVTARPSKPINSRAIGPPRDQTGAQVSQARLDPNDPSALAAAHDVFLGRQGRAPLLWAEDLEERARGVAVQMRLTQGAYSFCARTYAVNYSSRGEGVHIAPPAYTGDGLRAGAAVTVRQIMQQWWRERIGAFDAENRRVTRIGCVREICPQSSEIWVCRFD